MEICIDVDFESKMTHKELKSLCDHVRSCYAQCRKYGSRLVISGCTPKLWRLFQQRDAKKWDFERIQIYKEPIESLIDNAVYLTADSDNIIDTLDPNTSYIIGGIVDRNRHKFLCQNKAKELGIPTARLPILDHVDLSASTVLTVNQVHEILLKRQHSSDWTFLSTLIPSRKQ